MSLLDDLFTEITGIERYQYSTPSPNIQLLSDHYAEIFGTMTGSVVVATDYSEEVARLLHRAKYVGDTRALEYALPVLNEALESILELDQDRTRALNSTEPWTQFVLWYVPIGLNRFIERGFNQSQFLAKALSKKQDIPLVRLALLAWSTGHQSRRTKFDRASTGGTKFYINTRLKGINKTLIIIDDVISTGATVWWLITALASQDWEHIIVLVLARNSQNFESLSRE
jgi:predicted amidophosphoribosyltransferase